MTHFDTHNILSDTRNGFRKHRSTETQLIGTIHDLAQTLKEGGQMDCILLDFSKAFDKVPHRRLLNKLKYYGVCGNTLNRISSFLQNRTQTVLVNGKTSRETPVLSGVPQGWALCWDHCCFWHTSMICRLRNITNQTICR